MMNSLQRQRTGQGELSSTAPEWLAVSVISGTKEEGGEKEKETMTEFYSKFSFFVSKITNIKDRAMFGARDGFASSSE